LSGKVIRVEHPGKGYDYSVFGGGCGYVVHAAKNLHVEPDDDVRFSDDGRYFLIVDSRGEVQRMKFLRLWFAPPPPPPPPGAEDTVDRQVAVAIEKVLDPKTEQAAFGDLEALGCPAVPAIIRHMEDWRNLPDPTIALRNKSPDAFEARRFYGPAKVVDALAAILNQITGQSFGFIYNGATDTERAKAVSGCLNFMRNTSKLCDGDR